MMTFPTRVARKQSAKVWNILSLISCPLAALHFVGALPAAKGQDSFDEVFGVDSSFTCRGSASLLQQERVRLETLGSLAEVASMQPQAPKTPLAATAPTQPEAPLSSPANLRWEWQRSKSAMAEWDQMPLSLKLVEAFSGNPVLSRGHLASKINVSNASNITSGNNVIGNSLVAKDMDDPNCTPGNQCGNGPSLQTSICIPRMNASGPNQCWDVCNTAHLPEDYDIGDGDKTFARQLAQAVREVRSGKVERLKCPGLGANIGSPTNASSASKNSSSNKSMNGTRTEYLEEQLIKIAKEAFQASQIADKASAQAASLMTAAQDQFLKALNPLNRSALSHAIELWEEAGSANAETSLKAGNVPETLKELRAMLNLFNKEEAEKVAQKNKVAKEKEVVANNLTHLAHQKRNEAVQAAAKAANATNEAIKALAEANATLNNLTNTTDQALKAALDGTTTPLANQLTDANQPNATKAPPANQSVSTQAPLANHSVTATVPPAETPPAPVTAAPA